MGEAQLKSYAFGGGIWGGEGEGGGSGTGEGGGKGGGGAASGARMSHSACEGRTTTFSLFNQSHSAGGLLADAMTPPLRVNTAACPPGKVPPEEESARAVSAGSPSKRSRTFFPELFMKLSCSAML